jgi:DNA-binding transcriptional MocR family regulator
MIGAMKTAGTLYEDVARRISGLIESGTWRPGDRIPSVRALSRELDVSISTTLEAYRLLEDRGFIDTRPQSGHYVRARCLADPATSPRFARPPREPTTVSVSDLVMTVLREGHDPANAPLGAALPNPDLLPVQTLRRKISAAIRRHPEITSAYDATPGWPALRAQIARRAVSAGCTIDPDEIVTTTGAQEALNLCLGATCKPGALVAVETPIFYGILQMIEERGLRAIEVATDARDGMNLDALSAMIRRNRISAVVAMPNFNNPVGSLMPEEKKKELVRMLAARDIPLIEDDIYGEIPHGLNRPRAAKAFDTKGLVLWCSSFSKTISPGLRVGWVGGGRLAGRIAELKFTSTLATSTLGQVALADFLAHGGYDHHLRRLRKAAASQVASVIQAVRRSFPDGTCVSTPAGGFVMWVELPEDKDTLKLHRMAVKAGISIAPGPIFSPRRRFRNCLRLSASYWSERIDRALETLGQLAHRA